MMRPLDSASRVTRLALLRRARRARGFTMVELLVAMVAGLLVAIGAFAFAKASSRAFQQETRISNAMGATTLGFRRLLSDLERASFLSTPNIQREYAFGNSVCLQPGPGFPIGIQSLAGLAVEAGGTYAPSGVVSPINVANQLSPDRLTIAGSMGTPEQFFVRAVIGGNGATTQVLLDPTSGAVSRVAAGDTSLNPWVGAGGRQGIFLQGRILRLVDQQGYQQFGVIQSVSMQGPGQPTVVLQNSPSIYLKGGPPGGPVNPSCAGIGLGVGVLANVVNRVRYEVRDLRSDVTFANFYSMADAIAEDQTRLELVRSEIDASNVQIVGSEEIIAEYAVDLKVGLTVATQVLSGGIPNPQLTAFPLDDAGGYGYALPTLSQALPGPERIRSVRVRLAVRSREPDRAADVPGVAGHPLLPNGKPGGLYRYAFASGRFARVRTLQAEVSLMNQSGVFY